MFVLAAEWVTLVPAWHATGSSAALATVISRACNRTARAAQWLPVYLLRVLVTAALRAVAGPRAERMVRGWQAGHWSAVSIRSVNQGSVRGVRSRLRREMPSRAPPALIGAHFASSGGASTSQLRRAFRTEPALPGDAASCFSHERSLLHGADSQTERRASSVNEVGKVVDRFEVTAVAPMANRCQGSCGGCLPAASRARAVSRGDEHWFRQPCAGRMPSHALGRLRA